MCIVDSDSLSPFQSPSCLHIAVAQGKRALAYVLATNMARCGSLDTKEHNGQVHNTCVSCWFRYGLQCWLLTVNPSCCDCVAFLYTDRSSDSSGRQSALDCPRPADTWSANQHPRPLGTLSAACVCRERPLSQSSGKASAHIAISVSGFFESIQLDQVYHGHFMVGNSVIS